MRCRGESKASGDWRGQREVGIHRRQFPADPAKLESWLISTAGPAGTLDARGRVITDSAGVVAGDRIRSLVSRGSIDSVATAPRAEDDTGDEQMYDSGHAEP